MRIAYLDCFSGISGDMFLGVLVDAGVPLRLLDDTVSALNVGARLEAARVDRCGISAIKVNVWVGHEKDLPREEYWKAKEEQDKVARQSHEHAHDHEHTHGHHHHEVEHRHEHPHRGMKEIREIIGKAKIAETAKARAIAIFQALADAEAKVHNTSHEAIHFHEVGAVDAIVDIVCAAVGSEAIGVDRWVCSPLNVGGGTVRCAHGEFPVPAPAVVELLRDAPVFSTGLLAELVTPTGAAIVKVLANDFAPIPGMKIEKVGYGAGSRDFETHSNVARILIGESGLAQHAAEREAPTTDIGAPHETISVLEANLDDLNPQVFGYVMERLLAVGALDVFGTPVQMKKSRPGVLLTVLCKPEHASKLTNLIFAETTTLGVRMREEHRAALIRRSISVQTKWGEVRLKVANLNGTVANYTPEYEDCRRIAEQHHIPLKNVLQEAARLYLEQNG